MTTVIPAWPHWSGTNLSLERCCVLDGRTWKLVRQFTDCSHLYRTEANDEEQMVGFELNEATRNQLMASLPRWDLRRRCDDATDEKITWPIWRPVFIDKIGSAHQTRLGMKIYILLYLAGEDPVLWMRLPGARRASPVKEHLRPDETLAISQNLPKWLAAQKGDGS